MYTTLFVLQAIHKCCEIKFAVLRINNKDAFKTDTFHHNIIGAEMKLIMQKWKFVAKLLNGEFFISLSNNTTKLF